MNSAKSFGTTHEVMNIADHIVPFAIILILCLFQKKYALINISIMADSVYNNIKSSLQNNGFGE